LKSAADPSEAKAEPINRRDWHDPQPHHEQGPIGAREGLIAGGLTKNRRQARAVILSHQLGWEVRLLVGSQAELVQSQVCRSQEEVLSTGETWKSAMLEKGWGTTTSGSLGRRAHQGAGARGLRAHSHNRRSGFLYCVIASRCHLHYGVESWIRDTRVECGHVEKYGLEFQPDT
jgi:hypothetical protein